MSKVSKLMALVAMLAAPASSYADDQNGNFPTDVLGIGNSFIFTSINSFSESMGYSFNKNSGQYDGKSTSQVVTFRRGVFENVDVAVGGKYYSEYNYRVSVLKGSSVVSQRLRGWGNPSFNVSYGLFNDKNNPFSLKLSLSASPNTSGNATGYISPYVTLGYKFNEVARLYTRVAFDHATNGNYHSGQGIMFGGQYDFSSSLTLEPRAEFKHFTSAGQYRSFNVNYLGFDVIYRVMDNFYVTPAFYNGWRSELTSRDNLAVYKASSNVRSYSLAVKYLF